MKMELGSDDVVSILDYFADLEDPRSSINRKHLLGDLIVICIMAVIAGADGPRSIGIWAASNVGWLKRYLALLKSFAITLLKQQPSKESIAMRRRMAGWNVDYLAQVVGLKRI